MQDVFSENLIPYLLLLLTVLLSLQGKKPRAVLFFGFLSIASALFYNVMDFVALGYIIMVFVSAFIWVNHFFADFLRKIGLVVFLVTGYMLLTHKIPGFSNILYFDNLKLSELSAPFDMFLNFDKVLLGLFSFHLLAHSDREIPFTRSLGTVLKFYLISFLVLLPIAFIFQFIQYDPKANPWILAWALNNLFFVCFSEEVIFRQFIQTHFLRIFRQRQYGDILAIVLASIVFGLFHLSGGMTYVIMASCAGLFYGLCYYQTGNIRSSIVLHFLVNLTHILFFTYPHS